MTEKINVEKQKIKDEVDVPLPEIVKEEVTVVEEEIEEIEVETVDAEEDLEREIEKFTQQVATRSSDNLPAFTDSNTSNDFALLNATAGSLHTIKAIAKEIIGSQLCPLKKESDVVVAILTGMQYNFPFMTSINNIYPINGKPSMSTHLHRALVLKHKIFFQKTEDFVPVYQFGLLASDGKSFDMVEQNIKGVIKKIPRQLKTGTLAEKGDNFGIIKEVDRVTKYKFIRYLEMPDKSFEKLEIFSEYKMSDADKAGLLEKDNWIKHPQYMLDARAFSKGSREIASDILLGIYTINELADDANVSYTVSSSLEETVR